MRRPVSGFLLALILLAVAVPAAVSCCFGPPPGHAAHPQPPRAAYAAAAAAFVVVQNQEQAIRGCSDHPAEPQTPYIETTGNAGGSGTVTSRGFHAGSDTSASWPSTTIVSAHRHGAAADDTGPPLWLTTCVSRT